MYSVLLIACSLVALCSAAAVRPAADPVRPVIPSTFEAMTKLELHRGEMVEFGTGYYCSDEAMQAQVRNETLERKPNEPHSEGYFFELELFKEHMEYHIRPDGGREECSNGHVRGDYVPPFAWIKDAKYNGSETIEHRTLDVWYTRFQSNEIAVGVEPDAPNVPVLLMERGVGEQRILEFVRFEATTPAAKYFEVPRQCKTPPK